MLTRSTAKKLILDTFISEVLELDDDDDIVLYIHQEKVRSIDDLLILPPRFIDNISISSSDGTSRPMAYHSKAKLHVIQAWNQYLLDKHDLRFVDWSNSSIVNDDEYNEFRVAIYQPVGLTSIKTEPSPSLMNPKFFTPSSKKSPSSISSRPTSHLAQEFRKGIKRDKAHYTVLKDEKQWNEWKRTTLATIYAHGCENIVDPTYVPADIEETLLFSEQKKYMYDVFTTILQTSMGKHFVRQHESTRNAQAVWTDYIQYMRTSTKADIAIENILSTLTSIRLTTDYRGTSQSFIIDWLDKLRQYEDLTPTGSHFPDSMKKSMLQNALNGIKAFRDVRTTEQMDIAKGLGAIPYENYVVLLQNVAARHDTLPTLTRTRSRTVHQHDSVQPIDDTPLVSVSDPDDLPDGTPHLQPRSDLDDNFGSFLAHVSETRKPHHPTRRPSLKKSTWQALSREDQLAWDQLSDKGKWSILTGRAPSDTHSRLAHITELSSVSPPDPDDITSDDSTPPSGTLDSIPSPSSDVLVNLASQRSLPHPGGIRRVLSQPSPAKSSPTKSPTPRSVQYHLHVPYRVSHNSAHPSRGALIDRGANGGLAGPDVRVISRTDRTVDVSGIDNHQMTHLPIVTAGGVASSQRGEVLVIFNQYAHVPSGRTIHSSTQLESFGLTVDEKSLHLGQGTQSITTPDGYVFPLNFVDGLAYMPLRPFTDHEWSHLPHVVFTSDTEWDPSFTDYNLTDDPNWFSSTPDHLGDYDFSSHNLIGQFSASVISVSSTWHLRHSASLGSELSAHAMVRKPSPKTYHQYRDYFLRASVDTIRKTFDATTQFARSGWITGYIQDTFRAPFPALNVRRRNEPVATDTIYCDTPAIDDGSTCAQFFTGLLTKFCDAYGMKTDSQFVSTLFDVIRRRGAMDSLISDSAQVEISKKVHDVLRHLCIDDWQSEAHYQHQNAAEGRYRDVKHNVNRVLNSSGAPASCWLLALQYVCFIMNRMALESLDWRTPFERLMGSTPDISMIYRFKFYDRVLFKRDESRGGKCFPSSSNEISGRFVGFSEHVGHQMCFKVLTDDTQKIIYRSRLKLAALDPNLRLHDPDPGGHPTTFDPGGTDPLPSISDTQPSHLRILSPDALDTNDAAPNPSDALDTNNDTPNASEDTPTASTEHLDSSEDTPTASTEHLDSTQPVHNVPEVLQTNEPSPLMAIIDANDLIGRSYLSEPHEDGTRFRLHIIEQLQQDENDLMNDPSMVRFRAVNDANTYEETLAYRQILEKLEAADGADDEWHFRSINNHRGPLTAADDDYKGSAWNVQIEWENGEITWEPLSIIAKSDPVSCAIYGKANNLLHLAGWKRFARLARRQKRLLRLANQAKLQSYRCSPVYKFGVQVPRNHDQAMELDRLNGNTLWRDAEGRELGQIDEYEAFEDKGIGACPKGHKKIRVHMVYDVKPTLQRKARLVADGHLTETPIDGTYSSVVSLRGLKLVLFLAELNKMEAWCTDIGNAYLEAYTEEKLFIIAGDEFGARKGHTLIIRKALYGLKSSGIRWWERFSDILRTLGFKPTRTENDIWIRDCGDHYEYITRYVDDLTIVSRNPQEILRQLKENHKLKLKGNGPIDYHLGCNFFRDEDGVLCMSPKRYIERMIETYVRLFGTKPKTTYTSPLEKGDHPELDTSDELGMEDTKKYQSLIGALQWVITLGRFDIATAVMTLSSFRVAPRIGHLDRVKRIYGYLSKMKHAALRFRTGVPDYSDIPDSIYDWERSIYGKVHETIPDDCPTPRGPPIVLTSYVDANLCHDMLTGRSVTGILHLVNQTILDYYTKKQPAVETATYGSEFMAARLATEQIMELRTSLRYLGARVEGSTYMFGDNQTVVNSCSVPRSRLHKRHVLLSFHRVREAIAAKITKFIFIPGTINPADLLSKHWGYQQIRTSLKAMLFWQGNTMDIE